MLELWFLITLIICCVLTVSMGIVYQIAFSLFLRNDSESNNPDIWCYKNWTCDDTNLKYLELQDYYNACNDPNGEKISIDTNTGMICGCNGASTDACEDQNKACFIFKNENNTETDMSTCKPSSGKLYAHNSLFFS